MHTAFLLIEDLPRRNATQVKNGWGELVRQVRVAGSVAVTHHDKVEMVVVDAQKYREMVRLLEIAQARDQVGLAALETDFDRRLARMKAPDARERIDAAMASRGRVSPRPKAGQSY